MRYIEITKAFLEVKLRAATETVAFVGEEIWRLRSRTGTEDPI